MELFTPQQIKNLNELELLVYFSATPSSIQEHACLPSYAHSGVGSARSARLRHHGAAPLPKGGL
ncbi:MAG: hypothetical protein ACLTVY_00110 [Faecalibacterium sp.]